MENSSPLSVPGRVVKIDESGNLSLGPASAGTHVELRPQEDGTVLLVPVKLTKMADLPRESYRGLDG